MRYMQKGDPRNGAFRDWLRSEFRRLDFYNRRGDRYLISEFARHCVEANGQEAAPNAVKDVAVRIGRYLSEDAPVLPTPDTCRELAKALGIPGYHALMQAGYLTSADLEEIGAAHDALRAADKAILTYMAR